MQKPDSTRSHNAHAGNCIVRILCRKKITTHH
jgi:hypothetical protein